MINSCAAYDCTNRRVKGSSMKFHRFPLQNKELCAKWIAAMKRDQFIPTENSHLCGDHFIATNYKYVDSQLNLKITLCHGRFPFNTDKESCY